MIRAEKITCKTKQKDKECCLNFSKVKLLSLFIFTYSCWLPMSHHFFMNIISSSRTQCPHSQKITAFVVCSVRACGTKYPLAFCIRKSSGSEWCGSVGWALSCKPEGHWFNSHQDTCLGCRPGPWLGICERQLINAFLSYWCFSPSLSPSLPFSLKINK